MVCRLGLLTGEPALKVLARTSWISGVVVLMSCANGGEEGGSTDAGAESADAAGPDASDPPSPDASSGIMEIDSAQDFPAPTAVIEDFTETEMSGLGVEGAGFNSGSGSITGNADAPIMDPFIFLSTPEGAASFAFDAPITAAGISAADADFTFNEAVEVTIEGLDAQGDPVASAQGSIQAASTGEEEDEFAVFVGFSNAPAVREVQVTIDQDNGTVLDNLRFVAQ